MNGTINKSEAKAPTYYKGTFMEERTTVSSKGDVTREALRPGFVAGGMLNLPRYVPKYTINSRIGSVFARDAASDWTENVDPKLTSNSSTRFKKKLPTNIDNKSNSINISIPFFKDQPVYTPNSGYENAIKNNNMSNFSLNSPMPLTDKQPNTPYTDNKPAPANSCCCGCREATTCTKVVVVVLVLVSAAAIAIAIGLGLYFGLRNSNGAPTTTLLYSKITTVAPNLLQSSRLTTIAPNYVTTTTSMSPVTLQVLLSMTNLQFVPAYNDTNSQLSQQLISLICLSFRQLMNSSNLSSGAYLNCTVNQFMPGSVEADTELTFDRPAQQLSTQVQQILVNDFNNSQGVFSKNLNSSMKLLNVTLIVVSRTIVSSQVTTTTSMSPATLQVLLSMTDLQFVPAYNDTNSQLSQQLISLICLSFRQLLMPAHLSSGAYLNCTVNQFMPGSVEADTKLTFDGPAQQLSTQVQQILVNDFNNSQGVFSKNLNSSMKLLNVTLIVVSRTIVSSQATTVSTLNAIITTPPLMPQSSANAVTTILTTIPYYPSSLITSILAPVSTVIQSTTNGDETQRPLSVQSSKANSNPAAIQTTVISDTVKPTTSRLDLYSTSQLQTTVTGIYLMSTVVSTYGAASSNKPEQPSPSVQTFAYSKAQESPVATSNDESVSTMIPATSEVRVQSTTSQDQTSLANGIPTTVVASTQNPTTSQVGVLATTSHGQTSLANANPTTTVVASTQNPTTSQVGVLATTSHGQTSLANVNPTTTFVASTQNPTTSQIGVLATTSHGQTSLANVNPTTTVVASTQNPTTSQVGVLATTSHGQTSLANVNPTTTVVASTQNPTTSQVGVLATTSHGQTSLANVNPTTTVVASTQNPTTSQIGVLATTSHGQTSLANVNPTTTVVASTQNPTTSQIGVLATTSHGQTSLANVNPTTTVVASTQNPTTSQVGVLATTSHGPTSLANVNHTTTVIASTQNPTTSQVGVLATTSHGQTSLANVNPTTTVVASTQNPTTSQVGVLATTSHGQTSLANVNPTTTVVASTQNPTTSQVGVLATTSHGQTYGNPSATVITSTKTPTTS